MRKNGDTPLTLYRAVKKPGVKLGRKTIHHWNLGLRNPSWWSSLNALSEIERHYGLPAGFFLKRLPVDKYQFVLRVLKEKMSGGQQRLLRWHLPETFLNMSEARQREIIAWIRKNIFTENSE
jgi:hypothetical protein